MISTIGDKFGHELNHLVGVDFGGNVDFVYVSGVSWSFLRLVGGK